MTGNHPSPGPAAYSLPQRLAAEGLGSLLLTVTAISPIILARQVLGAPLALAVLMDALAVGFVLFVLIEILEPVSYCHINPAVTLAMMVSGHLEVRVGLWYIPFQFLGGLVGVLASHLMFFHQPFFHLLSLSAVHRQGGPYFAELVGTFVLVLAIYGCMARRSRQLGLTLGLLVGGFLITTSSTMFANPQVTLSRVFTFSAAGISPTDALFFMVMEVVGALAAVKAADFLFEAKGEAACRPAPAGLQTSIDLVPPGPGACCPGTGDGPGLVPAGLDQAFVTGVLETPAGKIPRVDHRLSPADRWGSLLVRLSWKRNHYRVDPGLYGLGRPGPESPVLVTANYKLSFDCLRSALAGHAAWILVLDTGGINVWCAAGKGSFGTEELARRVRGHQLAKVVSHRRLVLPQKGAPGVAAYRLKSLCGFSAAYGPVRARDLPAYLEAGGKADPAMRRVEFPLAERAVLIPVEVVQALKYYLFIVPLIILLSGAAGPGEFWSAAWEHGAPACLALFLALAAGAVVTPLLLPWLPGRAFSLKALWPGLAADLGFLLLSLDRLDSLAGLLETVAWLLIIPALGSFLALNFTGASTYTSLSGVRKEMRRAMPLLAGAGLVGTGLGLAGMLMV